MKLVTGYATQHAALTTIRELIAAGVAGLDCYDRDIFVVDAPQEQRDLADVALDHLGAQMIRDGGYGAPERVLQCRLPHWARVELELNRLHAPEIIVPLASRAAPYRSLDPPALGGGVAAASLDVMIDELETRAR